MTIEREPFGTAGGEDVWRYTLSNGQLRVRILTYGGIVQTLEVPDRAGQLANVSLGFATLEPYVTASPYFGALIGRYANRIGGAQFELDGVRYSLVPNDGPNALHGGAGAGFDKRVWQPRPLPETVEPALELGLTSPNGDGGFPGELQVTAIYTLSADNALRLDYRASTDRPTVVNLTNHTYFNLSGEGSGSVEGHVLQLHASYYTPVDSTLIPTGAIEPVAGTPLDFTSPMRIGARLRSGFDQLTLAQGYDHNFVLDGGASPRLAARVVDPASGRTLEVRTTEPGLQFYTANFLTGSLVGSSGRAYRQGDAFTLETQHIPDSPNRSAFPSTVLRPGEIFESTTVFAFSTVTPDT
jgi:aldose 1-epimerase